MPIAEPKRRPVRFATAFKEGLGVAAGAARSGDAAAASAPAPSKRLSRRVRSIVDSLLLVALTAYYERDNGQDAPHPAVLADGLRTGGGPRRGRVPAVASLRPDRCGPACGVFARSIRARRRGRRRDHRGGA